MSAKLFAGEAGADLSRADEAEHLLELFRSSPADVQRDDVRQLLVLALSAVAAAGLQTPAIDLAADVLTFDDHFALSALQARVDAARTERPVKAAASLAAACAEVLQVRGEPDPFDLAVIALRWSRTDLSFRAGGSPHAADARRLQAQQDVLTRWGAFALAVAAEVRSGRPGASKAHIADVIRKRWERTPRSPGEDSLPAKDSDIVKFLSSSGY